MLRKIFFFKLFLLNVIFLFAQPGKTCEQKEEVVLDLNSIAKCEIKTPKNGALSLSQRKSKTLTVQVVSSRRRVLRRRKKTSTTSNSITVTNKLAEIKHKSSLVSNIELNNSIDKLPFEFVDQKPRFSNCSIEEVSKCFKTQLLNHIKKNFKYPSSSFDKGVQGRVLVQFVIDEFGGVSEVITRGPYKGEELEKEAKRIINKLPKFVPGKVGNNSVKVKYGVPITFKIPGREPSNVREMSKGNVSLDNVVNFANVSKIPLFRKCIRGDDEKELDCFNAELSKHVTKYFAYPEEAVDRNIEGRVYVYFVIDKEGEVVNIRTRGPKNTRVLEIAAKQLVQKLPKFTPGLNGTDVVNVKYAFPINFKLK